jgi:hypothetical protein
MKMRKQTSMQTDEAMRNQISKLRQLGYGTFSNVIRIAVDRMYREETSKTRAQKFDPTIQNGGNQPYQQTNQDG